MKESLRKLLHLSPKERAVYQAVISLLEEGLDPGTIKVSEIAEKAKIGKGTVYEYFQSKKEIVAKALIYELVITVDEIQKKCDQVDGFWNKLDTILDWMNENFSNKTSFARLLQIGKSASGLPETIREEVCKYETDQSFYEELNRLVACGIEEGVLDSGMPAQFQCWVLLSNLLTYFMYLNESPESEITNQQMKEFICTTVKKSLSSQAV